MIEGGPGSRSRTHRSQPTGLGERCGTGAEALQLRHRPTQPRQQLIEMLVGQHVQLPLRKGIDLLLYPRKRRQRPRLCNRRVRLPNGSSIALPPTIGGHAVAGRRRCALIGLHR